MRQVYVCHDLLSTKSFDKCNLMNFSHLLCKYSGACIASPSRQRGKMRLTDTERFASAVKCTFKCVSPTLWNFTFCF